MKPILIFLTRHRRLLTIALLSVTLMVSSEISRRQLAGETIVTSLPVTSTRAPDQAVTAHAAAQADQHASDVAALTALIDRTDVDAQTRDDAAQQLLAMVANREHQAALEAALADTALAPCSAVVTGSQVTLITAQTEVAPEDSALLLTLAAAHCGSDAEDVRIITAR